MTRKPDELTEDQLPPKWTRKAFKDPLRAAEQAGAYARSARTPCEAAWTVPAYRAAVYAWLGNPDAPEVLIFHVQMPERQLRDAVFRRRVRTVDGVVVMVAVCSLSGSIFAGRRIAW